MAVNLNPGTPTAANPAQKVMTGGRAVVYVNQKPVGVFESCNYSTSIGTEPIHILGRYSPDEIAVTSYEAVTLNCSGFRVIDNGIHKNPAMPMLQDLLALTGVNITVVDRQTGKTILTAIGCIANSSNGSYNARATSRINVSYVGIRMSDENGAQDEGDGAISLP